MKVGDIYKRRYPSNVSKNPPVKLVAIHLEEEYVVLDGEHVSTRRGRRVYEQGEFEYNLTGFFNAWTKVQEG